jgi:hypothetical protein
MVVTYSDGELGPPAGQSPGCRPQFKLTSQGTFCYCKVLSIACACTPNGVVGGATCELADGSPTPIGPQGAPLKQQTDVSELIARVRVGKFTEIVQLLVLDSN